MSASHGIEGVQVLYFASVIKKYNYSKISMKLMFKSCHNFMISFWLLLIEYYVQEEEKHSYVSH